MILLFRGVLVYDHDVDLKLGSLSMRVFETRTATAKEHFVSQDSGVSQIFILIISSGEKILSNVNVVAWRRVRRENSSHPVAVRVSKPRLLKLPSPLSSLVPSPERVPWPPFFFSYYFLLRTLSSWGSKKISKKSMASFFFHKIYGQFHKIVGKEPLRVEQLTIKLNSFWSVK